MTEDRETKAAALTTDTEQEILEVITAASRGIDWTAPVDEEQATKGSERLAAKRALLRSVLQHIPAGHWFGMGAGAYLDGSGSRMALMALGCRFERKAWAPYVDGGGRRCIRSTAWLVYADGHMEEFFGLRYIGDPFAEAQEGLPRRAKEGFIVNEADALQAAFQNLYHNAAKDVFGLGNLTMESLWTDFGVRVGGARVEYDKGGRGGVGDVRMPFGNDKGKCPHELARDSLGWWIRHVATALQDPQRQKYRRTDEKLRDALHAELERRRAIAAQQAEEAGPPPGPEGEPVPDEPGTRG